MPDTHKAQVQEIRKLLDLAGGECYVCAQSQRLYGSAGIPDLIIFWPDAKGRSHMAFVEVKVGKDKLSPAQKAFRAHCARARKRYIVGRAGDVADALGLTGERHA